jgi:hypothetical protein
MDYKNYSEWHIVELNEQKYIFNPFFMGVGAWAELTFNNSPGRYATNQQELNQAFFGRTDLPSMYERFKNSSPSERENLKAQSMGWLNLKVKALKQSEQNLSIILDKYKRTFFNGGMFFYTYDAKTKDILPYWDKFPLILLLEKSGNSFLGLNLHYLDYDTRLKAISNILQTTSYNKTEDMLISNLVYRTIKYSPIYKDLKELCIKKYLVDHVRGRILPVESHEWIFAAMLPVADFQKKSNSSVWKKSKKQNLSK